MQRRAFTIMEMLLVMAVIVLVFTGAYVGLNEANAERELRKPYVDLRSLAKTAWQRALKEQNAYQITLYPDRMVLEPKVAINPEDQNMKAEADRAKGRGPGIEILPVPADVKVEVRHWRSKKWLPPQGDAWIFESSGLCEPISILFTREGRSIGGRFDPLTASVAEEIFDHEVQ